MPLEALDLSVPGAAAATADRVLAGHGCPDVLLNNAGILQFGPLESLSQAEVEHLYQVNVFGQLELIRSLLPSMRARGSGTIANVTSLGGTMVFPFFSGYNSTKWAMEALSEGLWHELKPFGIRVKAIEPGFVQTSIWSKALPGKGEGLEGPDDYRPYLKAMLAYESAIKSRTSPEEAAATVYEAIVDESDRLRYPVAAYAGRLVWARRLLGASRMMRFLHPRWLGNTRD
jgi:NAD(P)-dependent dehydrogenase (short-subunit alcohol dehydrogenase family)